MKFEKVYLAWVRNRYDHDFFYLEGDDEDYFAWKADQFGKSAAEQWVKFLGIIYNEEELPEPDFLSGSALHIYLHNPTYNSETCEVCRIYIEGIFPKKRKEVSDK